MAFTLSLILLLFIQPSSGEGMLSCNASYSEGDRDCFAFIGDTVVLTCILPEGARDVEILQGDAVVQNTTRRTISRTTQGYTLQIRNPMATDTAGYRCRWDYECTKWYYPCTWYRRLFWNDEVYIRLHAIQRQISECILANGLDGVFFLGEDIELLCPTNVTLDVKINSENVHINVTEITNGRLVNIQSARINDITASYNNSRLSCVTGGKDYCESLPTITVYDDLEVTVYPQTVEVTEGDKVSLTCSSFPKLQASVGWDLSDIANVVSSLDMSYSSKGSQNVTLHFTFQNVTEIKNQYMIKCRVMLGSKNVTKTAVLQYTDEDDVTTDVIQGSKNPVEDGKFRKTAIIIITVVIIVTVLLVGSIAGRRLWLKKVKEGAGLSTGRNINNLEEESITEKRQMKLSENDSVVAHNIVYEPYTGQ